MINRRLDAINRVLTNLKVMIDRHNYSQGHLDEFILDYIFAHRESKVHRFKICVDLFWKFLKQELFETYGVVVASPKKVMQECFKQNLLDSNELDAFLLMVDDRSATVHMYDETIIISISEKIESYYNYMIKIIQRLERNSTIIGCLFYYLLRECDTMARLLTLCIMMLVMSSTLLADVQEFPEGVQAGAACPIKTDKKNVMPSTHVDDTVDAGLHELDWPAEVVASTQSSLEQEAI